MYRLGVAQVQLHKIKCPIVKTVYSMVRVGLSVCPIMLIVYFILTKVQFLCPNLNGNLGTGIQVHIPVCINGGGGGGGLYDGTLEVPSYIPYYKLHFLYWFVPLQSF